MNDQKMIPQADLDRLRSSLDKQVAQQRKRAEAAEAKLAELQNRIAELEAQLDELYKQRLAEAQKWAKENAALRKQMEAKLEALQRVNQDLKNALWKHKAEDDLFRFFGMDIDEFRRLERKWRRTGKSLTIRKYLEEKAKERGLSVNELADQLVEEVRKRYERR